MSWIETVKITCESIANRIKNVLDSGKSVKNFYERLNRSDAEVMKAPEGVNKKEFDESAKKAQGVASDSYKGVKEQQDAKRGFEEARKNR